MGASSPQGFGVRVFGRGRAAIRYPILAVLTALVAALVVVVGSPAQGFPNPADESNHVNFTLEACKLTAGTTLPIAGQFICPDAMYTTGNLGKSWNELDLVPHRLTMEAGTQS